MRPRVSRSILGSPSESGLFEQVAQVRAGARRGPQGAGFGQHEHRLAGTHPVQWNRLFKTIVASLRAADATENVAIDLYCEGDWARIPERGLGDPKSHAESQAGLAPYPEFHLGMIAGPAPSISRIDIANDTFVSVRLVEVYVASR